MADDIEFEARERVAGIGATWCRMITDKPVEELTGDDIEWLRDSLKTLDQATPERRQWIMERNRQTEEDIAVWRERAALSPEGRGFPARDELKRMWDESPPETRARMFLDIGIRPGVDFPID